MRNCQERRLLQMMTVQPMDLLKTMGEHCCSTPKRRCSILQLMTKQTLLDDEA